ncbi:GIY-YIG nuclease family protein [Gordonia rubripertincta]|uniref:GIY-YIG nuclease family protein n=1 Tax=Gordonia rubripertincta TaxID=36822 RepID=A0AAW4GBL6_GORRU|nr:GIY-YIG nuclease family protein [Gordonia rubripertincta]MBM7280350.1 GIY-YIG nuclease family protein [Gordonia rubripertincta]
MTDEAFHDAYNCMPEFSDTPAAEKDRRLAVEREVTRQRVIKEMTIPHNPEFNRRLEKVVRICVWPGCDRATHPMPWDPDYELCAEHTMLAIEYGKRAQLDVTDWTGDNSRKVTRAQQQGTKDGWVYYARCGEHIKIGFATDVKKRMKAYPPGTVVVAVEPGGKALEKRRHKEFDHSLSDGREWFRESRPLTEHMAALRKAYGDTRDFNHSYTKHNRDGLKLKHTDTKRAWPLP